MKLKDWLDKYYTVQEQKNLIRLNCHGENITSLEGIQVLVNLKDLYCYNNELTSLKGIENLDKLEWLYCYSNKLTSLKGIEKLTKLNYLACSNNPLPYSDLDNLDKIKLEVKKEIRQYKIKRLLLYL